MIRVKLMSILVNDQNRARRFYTHVLGFRIKHDIPVGEASWLTLVASDDAGGVELLLEPTGHPAAVALQQALYNDSMPLAQLYTEDTAAEFERLRAKGVAFRNEPKTMGPTKYADFEIPAAISFGFSKASEGLGSAPQLYDRPIVTARSGPLPADPPQRSRD